MKKMLVITLSAAVVLGGALAINHSHAEEVKGSIGIDKAKNVALKEVDGIVENIELEKENSHAYYEVEIDKDNKEYEFHVDAKTANIKKVDEKTDDDDNDQVIKTQNKELAFISEEEAIQLAKNKFNGEVDEIEFDEDDGSYQYVIELRSAKEEAEITIDAVSKEILEFEKDNDF